MKSNSTSQAAFFNSRLLIGSVLCSAGLLLALAGLSISVTDSSGNPVLETAKFATTTTVPDRDAVNFPKARNYASTKLTYRLIDAPKHTFCYDVFVDGRLLIHQSSVPALPGNEGFRTKEDASNVALLVIDKFKKGQMPPTVSLEEMKSLHAIN
jgi:hypothetical protein